MQQCKAPRIQWNIVVAVLEPWRPTQDWKRSEQMWCGILVSTQPEQQLQSPSKTVKRGCCFVGHNIEVRRRCRHGVDFSALVNTIAFRTKVNCGDWQVLFLSASFQEFWHCQLHRAGGVSEKPEETIYNILMELDHE